MATLTGRYFSITWTFFEIRFRSYASSTHQFAKADRVMPLLVMLQVTWRKIRYYIVMSDRPDSSHTVYIYLSSSNPVHYIEYGNICIRHDNVKFRRFADELKLSRRCFGCRLDFNAVIIRLSISVHRRHIVETSDMFVCDINFLITSNFVVFT